MHQENLIKHTSNSGSRISKLTIVREEKSQAIPAEAMKAKELEHQRGEWSASSSGCFTLGIH
jgi:hypothetical protein